MRFHFLGPMEAFDGPREVALGAPKQRLVLAHLLARANQVVAGDGLIDLVWGERAPAAARASLHSYVSHLRKALGRDRIENHGQGYLLRAEPDEVDGLRFEALARQGRRLLAQDPSAAARVLSDALALWRGTIPFADLSAEPSLAAEIARLDELRLAALEDRVAADLASGASAHLVGELEALTAAHPLRERLWAHLMLALYRSGRQGEALGAYERARRLLADELGIDPSPELQRLHARVLAQDPQLEPARRALRGYELMERIGRGRFGTVWRALQPGTGREVAVKAFDWRVANEPGFVRGFEARAQAVAAIEHPHVVPVYDYWREPDGAYVVTRFMRGGSLQALVERQGLPDPASALRATEQVLQALFAAHRREVVHGDVGSHNVLLDEEGNAYLADFVPVGESDARTGAADDVRAAGVLLSSLFADPPSALAEAIDRAATADAGCGHADAAVVLAAMRDARLPTAVGGSAAKRPLARGTATSPTGAGRRNPYKGLRAFSEADALDFFGREALTAHLVARLRVGGPAGRFLAVVGPSGSGKSSVVRAGLVPALRGGALPGSQDWFVVELAPGAYPFEELEAALLRVAVNPPPSLLEQLESNDTGLLRAVKRVLPAGDGELALIIDQFEELFTLVDDDRCRRFLAGLVAAVTDPRSRLRVVVTLRADFYDRPLRHPGLAELVRARTEAVVPLTAEELERAVTGPAGHVGVAVDPGLVARMVADVADQPGGLPLLQYALTELFDRRQDVTLTPAVYREIGGVSGALGRRADAIHQQLDDSGRDAAQQVFLRLVTLGEGVADTRRRVPRSELRSLHDDPDLIDAVIDEFGAARLLSFDRDPETRAPTVEVAHEALLREWGRLRAWIDAARDDLRTARRLSAAACDWDDAGRDPSYLVSGGRLDQLEAWQQRAGLATTPAERDFLAASLAERDRARAAEQAREARERALEHRAWRRLRALVAVFALAALVAGGLTAAALTQSRRVAQQARVSTARELAAGAVTNLDVDPERSILLALDAIDATYETDGTVVREAETALHRALRQSRLVATVPQGGGLAVSPDGARFATSAQDGTATIWDIATMEPVQTLGGHADWVYNIAFSPDGGLLATTDESGTVRIWDADSGRRINSWRAHRGEAVGVVFSPDRRRLVTTGDDGVIRVWDVVTGERERVLGGHTERVAQPAFSPDGSLLATPSWDQAAGIWDWETGETVAMLTGHEWAIEAVAFSPDGTRVATAGGATARIWNVASGELVATFAGHQMLNAVAFDRDGTRLATAGMDATVRLWDVDTGRRLLTLAGHAGEVVNVAFTPEGDRILTSALDGTTRLWDISPQGARDWVTVPVPANRWAGVTFSPDASRFAVPGDTDGVTIRDVRTGDVIQTLSGHEAATPRVAFSPDGTRVAGVAGGGLDPAPIHRTVPVWDVETGEVELILTGHRALATAVAFSPDGRRLVTGARDGTARVWNAASGEEQHTLLTGAPVFDVAFSPDERFVAAGGENGTVNVLDAATADHVGSLEGHNRNHPVFGLAFLPDGRLVTAGDDGTARVWDVTSRDELVVFHGHGAAVNRVAVSPDGTRVATVSDDATARLWDPTTGQESLTLDGHEAGVYGVAFSPDGRFLATSGTDGTAALYLLPVDELREVARERVSRGLTEEECRQYLQPAQCTEPPTGWAPTQTSSTRKLRPDQRPFYGRGPVPASGEIQRD